MPNPEHVPYDERKYDSSIRKAEDMPADTPVELRKDEESTRWSEDKAQKVTQAAQDGDRIYDWDKFDDRIARDTKDLQTLRDKKLLHQAGLYPQNTRSFRDENEFDDHAPKSLEDEITVAERILESERKERNESINELTNGPEELYNSNPEKYSRMTVQEFLQAYAEYYQLKTIELKWFRTSDLLDEFLKELREAQRNNSSDVPYSLLLAPHPDWNNIMINLHGYVHGSIDKLTVSPAERTQRLIEACIAAQPVVTSHIQHVQDSIDAILHSR